MGSDSGPSSSSSRGRSNNESQRMHDEGFRLHSGSGSIAARCIYALFLSNLNLCLQLLIYHSSISLSYELVHTQASSEIVARFLIYGNIGMRTCSCNVTAAHPRQIRARERILAWSSAIPRPFSIIFKDRRAAPMVAPIEETLGAPAQLPFYHRISIAVPGGIRSWSPLDIASSRTASM